MSNPAHDPLCKGGDCTCTCDQLQEGHRRGCPGEDCDCLFIAEIRADERSRKGTWWREAEGSQIPAGAIRVYREAGWFWEMP